MKVTLSVAGRFHFFNLAHEFEKRGHLERLITSYPKFETAKYGVPKEKIQSILIREILYRGLKRVPFHFDFFKLLFCIDDLFDNIASHYIKDPDIFIGFSSFSLRSMKKAKKLGAKIVLDHGSSHILFHNSMLKEEYKKYGGKELFGRNATKKLLQEYEMTDYISVPSLFAKKTFLEQGFPENKIIHVPYGVNLEEFNQVGKKDDVFRVIFTGGMCLRKGVHYLLQAWSELNLSNSELLLIGSINDEIKPFFKKYEGKFKWIGHIKQKELYKYYSQGSVFVLPSIEDGFGMVISQAMACGLPVIATVNTGGPDVIREGKDGFIIPIRNIQKLKEKLLYLYENPDLCKQMGQSAKERMKKFTWDEYGDKMVLALKSLL